MTKIIVLGKKYPICECQTNDSLNYLIAFVWTIMKITSRLSSWQWGTASELFKGVFTWQFPSPWGQWWPAPYPRANTINNAGTGQQKVSTFLYFVWWFFRYCWYVQINWQAPKNVTGNGNGNRNGVWTHSQVETVQTALTATTTTWGSLTWSWISTPFPVTQNIKSRCPWKIPSQGF